MEKIKLHDKEFVKFIERETIESAIKEVADQLNDKFTDSKQPPVFVTILGGAFMFVGELMRHINFEVDMAFTNISSYSGTQRGEIKCNLELKIDVKDRDVVMLDEIIDSGKTAAFLVDKYRNEGAKSVAVATMIYKPKTVMEGLNIEYRAIEMMEDNFIVGYGLDYNEKGRSLRDIYILAPENEQ